VAAVWTILSMAEKARIKPIAKVSKNTGPRPKMDLGHFLMANFSSIISASITLIIIIILGLLDHVLM